MNDLLHNPISDLEIDDAAFLKLSAARDHLKKIEDAISLVDVLQKALLTNPNWITPEQKESFLMELVITVPPYIACDIIQSVERDLKLLLKDAKEKVDNL